ncbi:MAG: hypothetical protein GEU95_17695 [Rhizobiales bacterium]|nr:hypothetical protein [Hyphomicrobiales bacterium]
MKRGPAENITIKRLRVFAAPGGRLLFNYREGAQRPADDAWWDDVLLDPRAYKPVNETSFDEASPFAYLRLDRQRGETVAFTCACGRGRVIDKTELIEGLGASANVLWVARRVILDCERRNKIGNCCQAYCVR